MNVDRLTVSYGDDDGVGAGNIDLRIATSINARANWTGLAQTVDDTTFSPNASIQDSMAALTMTPGVTDLYVALARLAGTTTNTLSPSTGVETVDGTPVSFALSQNFPNPFNPDTRIEFSLPVSGHVRLSVFNIL